MEVQSVGSPPRLPRIDTGYATPGSDYMSSYRGHPRTVAKETVSQNRPFRSSASSDGSQSLDVRQPALENRTAKHYSSYSKCLNNQENRINVNSKPMAASGQGRFIRDHTVPVVQNVKNGHPVAKSYTDISYSRLSPLKSTNSARKSSLKGSIRSVNAWEPPAISAENYESAKDKLTSGGKFKEQMIKYFKLEKHWWEDKSDSEDDGYDTDLDKQLGLLLFSSLIDE